MKKLHTLIIAGSLAAASFSAQAGVIFGPVVNPANGHTYYQIRTTTWPEAQAEALTLGGNLVTINDAAENQWLVDTFDGNNWIGLNDIDEEGVFEWVSGEPVTYTNWAAGEPNNCCGNEDYGQFYNDGQWNDLFPDQMNALVEVSRPKNGVPEGGSGLALLGLVLGGLTLAKRRAK